MYRSKLNEKLQESLAAVLPILAIVLILSFTIAPLPTSVLMAFLFGAVLLVVGMMFFSLGAELAMSPMGERVGACITKTRRVGIMLTLGFLLGFLITISEPDLQVLANQVQAVPNMVLIVTVAVGVDCFSASPCCVCCSPSRSTRCWWASTSWFLFSPCSCPRISLP